ncbi:uncharacterized protein LOC129908573 isoform X2 [Episyrphus balteatus]|nr:uncharacterized protein LOC129908573 isoform X2 [Episyrphus balteatus]
MLKTYNIPMILYNTNTKNADIKKFEEKLLKFENICQKNGIRNKILLNFPSSFEESLLLQKCNIKVTNIINLTSQNQTEINLKEVLDFYRSITKQISFSKYDDIDGLAAKIFHKIKYSPSPKSNFGLGKNFVYRVVIIGRRGSGRQTQAKMLAVRYNSVYINVESHIEQILHSKNDNMAKVLSISYSKHKHFSSSAITAALWKRLLEPDTLSRGWIIVNFPKSINELEILVEKFQTPPNRFVILHCPKSIALQRLVKQWDESKDGFKLKNTISRVEKEFSEYDENIRDMYTYLKSTKVKTIHVDGKGCSLAIKNKIFALLER